MAANLTPIVAHGNWDDFIFKLVVGGGLAIFVAVYLIMLAIVYLVSKRSLVKVSNIKVKALYVTVIGLIIHNLIVFVFDLDQDELWLISFATTPYVAILLFLILFVNLYIKLWPKFNPPPTQQQPPSQKDEIEK